MHYCTAEIRIGNEHHTVVVRDTFRPVSWPEIEILRAIHGNAAITNAKAFVSVKQSPKEEKERLRMIYGTIVEDVFPGRNPQMEMEAAGAKLPEPTPAWRDPVERDPVQSDFNPTTEAPADKNAVKPKPATTF